ncbi:39S ribosomal protein L42, mitochondrial [Tetranychus urticae]|uniref:39S ribosomal protein L42, mitochondrial n=1 Tax=Tetranychus urticae TaxID=32264 RepID=UPI00077BEFF8|nr:39S ribosomal protein L42, mitochondrial [Tetranychus urticae]
MFARLSSASFVNLRTIQSRLFSSSAKSFDQSDVQISLTDDGRTIVMYHPEPSFPYEHTKPLPVEEPKLKEEDSVLRVDLREDVDDIMFGRDLTAEELIRLTNQSRRFWREKDCHTRFFNRRKLKSKSIWDNKDREGI